MTGKDISSEWDPADVMHFVTGLGGFSMIFGSADAVLVEIGSEHTA